MTELAKLELVESIENYNVPGIIQLPSEKTTTLGRSSKQCTVVLDATPAKSISRKHAEIVCRKGRRGRDTYILRDLDSTNGVFVNEFKIQEQPLEHGDVVQFGGAADIPVGTRFGGTGSHIRYRFDHEVAAPAAQESRKRRQSAEPTPDTSSAQRPKVERADTLDAVDALRAIRDGAAGGSSAAEAGGVGAVDDGGETPITVTEVLRDAMCGLCSELLLDAGVLPCSHSFCRLCWADHVEEKGTTCPVCMRKMHSSERNPRHCSNLDLLITSIVHKLAGPQERERWAARQQQAQKRAAEKACLVNNSNGATTEAAPKAGPPSRAAVSNPSPARGVHFAENGSGGPSGSARSGRVQGEPGQRDSTSRRYSGNGRGAAEEVVEKCEGCNEEGHEFRECPHRSDSALEGSEDGDDDEEESDEEEEEEAYSDDA